MSRGDDGLRFDLRDLFFEEEGVKREEEFGRVELESLFVEVFSYLSENLRYAMTC